MFIIGIVPIDVGTVIFAIFPNNVFKKDVNFIPCTAGCIDSPPIYTLPSCMIIDDSPTVCFISSLLNSIDEPSRDSLYPN